MTIGFARRFAPTSVQTWSSAILNGSSHRRRIQFVFSGKAHPKDEGGKQRFATFSHLRRKYRMTFLWLIENYDMATGLAMTSGVDIWLNNPIRPLKPLEHRA